jgi:dipeptide transport system ATP-binding protein
MSLLDIQNLSVEFGAKGSAFRAVDALDLRLDQGQVLGIVGESGSGKSVSMMALMGLLAGQGRVMADELMFDGKNLQTISDRERRKLLGKDMAMIFQDPMTSLNPSFTVGFQLIEVLKHHMGLRGAAADNARSSCWRWWKSQVLPAGWRAIRTSSQAAWRSA